MEPRRTSHPKKPSLLREFIMEYVLGPGIFLTYVAFFVLLAIKLDLSDGQAALLFVFSGFFGLALIVLFARIARARDRRNNHRNS